ncbi:hypothetical protein [Rheinheimera sp.]|uniref:hypothetical protein n=1 Tax=Rheinheimera sp. TaxID=1869214 RepID=UPI0027356C4C|nr:hypothetical protein [Rheinheimera sp.]MDP2713735.1 hypothetical protein [Rheinheimera sp.]
MRWLSSVAILFYLSLLCTPQAFAVHDVRLSPLADSQLYAISPALPQALLSVTPDADDAPPAALLPAALNVAHYGTSIVTVSPVTPVNSQVLTSPQARAPPLFSSR